MVMIVMMMKKTFENEVSTLVSYKVRSPSPMYLLRSSGPFTEIEFMFPHAAAAARAKAVFPQPGGPYRSAPLGSRDDGTVANKGAYLIKGA